MMTLSPMARGSMILFALTLSYGCSTSKSDEEPTMVPDTTAADAAEVADPVDMGMATEMNERRVLRSPSASGDEPAHRQTRPSPAPSQQRRRGDGPETEACEAESLITSDGPALVFRNLSALNTHMPFSAAISALSTSGGGMGSAAEQDAIIQSMLNTFDANITMINSAGNALNGNSDVFIDLPERAGEFSMPSSSFISQMVPLATFNRLDLASSDGSICGEQRITYALGGPTNNQVSPIINGQFTVIFEARYPNPLQDPANAGHPLAQNLTNTIADCLPVAEFWESIALMNDDNDRAIAMSEFFLTGHTIVSSGASNGVFLPPVVTFVNYQSPLGQIRTNQFVDPLWELREFRTDISTGSVALIADSVKGNPVTGLYDANSAFAQSNPQLRANFMTELSAQMDNLLAPEILGLTATEQILTSFEPTFPDGFSGFTSVSQGNADNPATQASQDVRALITAEITARLGNQIPQNSTVNEDEVLNRLGAMTCGGCHQYSSSAGGVAITDIVAWPVIGASQAFVQVRDIGGVDAALSAGLTGTFLPLRREFLLDTWLCDEASTSGCASNDECPDGFICVAGECVEEPDPMGCQTDADCPTGYICDEYGDCVLPIEPITICDEPHADIVQPTDVQDTHVDASSEVQGSCGGDGAEDLVIFTPEEGGLHCLTTKGSRGTTFLHVRQADCNSPRAEVGCASSLNGPAPGVAQLELDFQVGIPYFIFVDSSGEPDVWHLNMQIGACPGSADPDPEPDPTNACEVPHPGSPVDQSLVGDSDENQNNFSGSCGGAGSEDVVVFVPEESGTYCLNTVGSQIDTAVYVRAAICTDDSAEIGCAASREFPPNTSPADTGEPPGIARLEVMLEASDTYYIFVDALVGNRGGQWALTVISGQCRGASNPPGGLDEDNNGEADGNMRDRNGP